MTIEGTVYVVEDDAAVRDSTVLFLTHQGWAVRAYSSAAEFLASVDSSATGCLLLDIRMPDITGLELQRLLKERHYDLPIIFLTGHADVKQSVQALKSGAMDFFEKPYDQTLLKTRVAEALAQHASIRAQKQLASEYYACRASLTPREREVMQLMIEGMSSKLIARKIEISPRTVEVYRANIMQKMQVSSAAELATIAVKSEQSGFSPK